MKSQLQPCHLLLLILAGWINRRQQDAVEYLLTENQILRERLGKKRILLDDSQRAGSPSKARSSGFDNGLIDPGQEVGLTAGEVECRERLGGILRYYHRKAA